MLPLKKFSLYSPCRSTHERLDIIDESVLALSLTRNLTVSTNTRITTTAIICICMRCIPYAMIQVWGLFPFICIQVLSEPLVE